MFGKYGAVGVPDRSHGEGRSGIARGAMLPHLGGRQVHGTMIALGPSVMQGVYVAIGASSCERNRRATLTLLSSKPLVSLLA